MGVLVVHDVAGIGCANWVLRAIACEIAGILKEQEHAELATWLMSEESPVFLYSDLDIRDLTPANQKAVLDAIEPAYERSKGRGPVDWSDPKAWDGYIDLFEKLAVQGKMVREGLVPSNLPYLSDIPVHDGGRGGPGWNAH